MSYFLLTRFIIGNGQPAPTIPEFILKNPTTTSSSSSTRGTAHSHHPQLQAFPTVAAPNSSFTNNNNPLPSFKPPSSLHVSYPSSHSYLPIFPHPSQSSSSSSSTNERPSFDPFLAETHRQFSRRPGAAVQGGGTSSSSSGIGSTTDNQVYYDRRRIICNSKKGGNPFRPSGLARSSQGGDGGNVAKAAPPTMKRRLCVVPKSQQPLKSGKKQAKIESYASRAALGVG